MSLYSVLVEGFSSVLPTSPMGVLIESGFRHELQDTAQTHPKGGTYPSGHLWLFVHILDHGRMKYCLVVEVLQQM